MRVMVFGVCLSEESHPSDDAEEFRRLKLIQIWRDVSCIQTVVSVRVVNRALKEAFRMLQLSRDKEER